MLRLDRVSKTYPGQSADRPALRELTLEIRAGETLAVIGPNGSGKSTLLGLLSGVLAPTTGSVTGRPVCAVVLQRTALDALLTVRENAVLFARVYGVPSGERGARLSEAAKLTGLTERLDHRVGRLSGGLARRADLLRALMVGPELLILDEPAAGLDRESHRAVSETLGTINERLGVAIVVATHDLTDAARADRVLLMGEGMVVAEGSPKVLIEELGAEVVIERADGSRSLTSREQAAITTAELLARGEAFTVRDVSLVDVYDRTLAVSR